MKGFFSIASDELALLIYTSPSVLYIYFHMITPSIHYSCNNWQTDHGQCMLWLRYYRIVQESNLCIYLALQ